MEGTNGMTITVPVNEANLSDGSALQVPAEVYAERLIDALHSEFPNARIEIEIRFGAEGPESPSTIVGDSGLTEVLPKVETTRRLVWSQVSADPSSWTNRDDPKYD